MRKLFCKNIKVQHLKDAGSGFWDEIVPLFESELTATQTNDRGTPYWKQELSLTVNYNVIEEVAPFGNGYYRAKIKTSTGSEFVWGTVENPIETNLNTQEGSAVISFFRNAVQPEF